MMFYAPRNIGPADQLLFDADGNAVGIQAAGSSSQPVLGFNPTKHAAIDSLVSGEGKYRKPMFVFAGAYGLTNTRQATGTGDTMAADATITRLGTPTVKLTLPTNGTLWGELALPAMAQKMPRLRVGMLVYIPDYTKIGNITVYMAKEVGYTNFVTCVYRIMDTGGNPNRHNGWHYITWPNSNATTWSVGSGTVAEGDTIAAAKVRVNPAGGTNGGVVNFHSMFHDAAVAKPTILITADDGDASWFNLGIPYLNAKNLKSTHSVIGSLIGTGGYATLAQLQAAYDSGHDYVVHGATNLTSLGTTALRIADVLANQQWLVANGFTRNLGWRHYAYPNGAYELSNGDPEIITIVKQAGMLSGRGTQKPTRIDHAVDMGDRWYSYNIIGGESTESPATLQAAIDGCITYGESGVLMFHNLVTGVAGTAIEYNVDDFKAVMDYIAAKRDAGQINVMTIPEWYASVRASLDVAVA